MRAVLLATLLSMPAQAATPAEIDYAVQGILAREGVRFVTYEVDETGRVHLLSGHNEPAWRIETAVEALQSHPDIAGLVWTPLDTEFCPIR